MSEMTDLLKNYVIPPGILSLKRKFVQSGLFSRHMESFSENKRFMNIHKGKRCFILATGPSIAMQDLKPLKDEICIAVSNFVVHPDFDIIKPAYYCIAPSHPPITDEQFSSWLIDIDKRNPYSNFFMGQTDQRLVRSSFLFKNRVNYLPLCASDVYCPPDICSYLASPRSVSIQALYVAIYMGFKQIFLLGCDHSWITHYGESRHFYKEQEHSMVKNGYNEWSPCSNELECQWKQLYELWIQYRELREYAKANGTAIVNATQGGLLDVFPRVNYEKLFN